MNETEKIMSFFLANMPVGFSYRIPFMVLFHSPPMVQQATRQDISSIKFTKSQPLSGF